MAQPIWITPAGSLGVIQETVVYQNFVVAQDPDASPITYRIIAGELPSGVQFLSTGQIQGVPFPVGRDVESRFTVRASTSTLPPRIADRTFSITVTGNNVPLWVTPAGSIGSFYTSQRIDYQFQWADNDPDDNVRVRLVYGELPGGLTLSSTGKLTGYIQPPIDIGRPPGYDITPEDTEPYDFLYQAVNKNYEFTLETTDGKTSDLRIFSMYVYNRKTLNASTTQITADNTFITADETTDNAPFLVNSDPSYIGSFRSSNYFAYQFVGEDYDNSAIVYAISVNQGIGLPPGIGLDPTSGWYYGYIPDQGATETTYSFNIVVYKKDFLKTTVNIVGTNSTYVKVDPIFGNATFYNTVTATPIGNLEVGDAIVPSESIGGLVAGEIYYISYIVDTYSVPGTNPTTYIVFQLDGATVSDSAGSVVTDIPVVCTSSRSGTNAITCNSTAALGVGQPLIFTGDAFGGISTSEQQVYYVHEILSTTKFTISTVLGSVYSTPLTTDTGTLIANKITASEPYPFTITITGAVDSQVTWLTPSDLGSIANGSTSILKIEAENRGGRQLAYRLKSGAYNLLPQGLELKPSGDIVGRVSFDTFSLDLGKTTLDQSVAINRNITSLGTTIDSTFTFTVNAYAAETVQTLYKVDSVTILDGGFGYNPLYPPVLEFSAPPNGAASVTALVGDITIVGGVITAVQILNQGDGYTSTPTLTVTQGHGGSNASFGVNIIASGSRDIVSAFKTFTVRVVREYNKPYQNLLIRAMPPQNDRDIIQSLLSNEHIFVPEWIFRPDDPFFGKATNVTYAHAYGLNPETLDVYVAALYRNHYWKNLVLGEIETAQALDDSGNVIYEVVYSKIIDDLVNNQDQSVAKIVNLPYPINDPMTGDPIAQVYPNSLVDMRTQMVDVVGQESTTLPRWMVSKQTNGNILGYTPAWVIAYTIPGKSREIAYRIQTEFTGNLNQVDFQVDRYILDCELSRNWNYTGEYVSGHNPPPGPVGDVDVGPGIWNPQPPTLTTFDIFNTGQTVFLSTVNIATDLAYADVQGRTASYINSLGGLDGTISDINGNTLIFVKQDNYDGPPGSSYPTADAAWQKYVYPYDSYGFNEYPSTYDETMTIPGGVLIECTKTESATNRITCNFTGGLVPGQEIVFADTPTTPIGGIVAGTIYYILNVVNFNQFTITATPGGTTPVSLSNANGLMYAEAADQRMAIYTINVDPLTGVINLVLTTQTHELEYVQITRGEFYINSNLYYPKAPAVGEVRIAWQLLPPVIAGQTTFDQNSLQFVDPVDMYDPGETFDKYLVFPKSNILV